MDNYSESVEQIADGRAAVEFKWRWWRFAVLSRRIPKWCFFEWRWDYPVNVRWVAIGRFAVKIGGWL